MTLSPFLWRPNLHVWAFLHLGNPALSGDEHYCKWHLQASLVIRKWKWWSTFAKTTHKNVSLCQCAPVQCQQWKKNLPDALALTDNELCKEMALNWKCEHLHKKHLVKPFFFFGNSCSLWAWSNKYIPEISLTNKLNCLQRLSVLKIWIERDSSAWPFLFRLCSSATISPFGRWSCVLPFFQHFRIVSLR